MLGPPDDLEAELDKLDDFLVDLRKEAGKSLDISIKEAESKLVGQPLCKPNDVAFKKV